MTTLIKREKFKSIWFNVDSHRDWKKMSTVIFDTLCVLVLYYKKHGNKFKALAALSKNWNNTIISIKSPERQDSQSTEYRSSLK